MDAPGTPDAVTTGTSDTTDTNGGQPVSESPVARPAPPLADRIIDLLTGTGMMMFGFVLVYRAVNPQEGNTWQSQ
jgi:hypothetical protein